MKPIALIRPRRGIALVVVTLAFLVLQALPAYAGGSGIKVKLTSATSMKLRKHGSYYLYGYATDGSAASTALQDQQFSVVDADGFTSAAIAGGPTKVNAYSTASATHELVGVRIPAAWGEYLGVVSNSNGGPGSPLSTTTSFSITQSNTLVEIVGVGSGQQTSSLTGVAGLHVQASSSTEAVQVASVSDLAPGDYSVTLNSSQTAPDQDPNHAAALLAVFEFAP